MPPTIWVSNGSVTPGPLECIPHHFTPKPIPRKPGRGRFAGLAYVQSKLSVLSGHNSPYSASHTILLSRKPKLNPLGIQTVPPRVATGQLGGRKGFLSARCTQSPGCLGTRRKLVPGSKKGHHHFSLRCQFFSFFSAGNWALKVPEPSTKVPR